MTERVSRWTQVSGWVCSWWRAFRPQHDDQQHNGDEHPMYFATVPEQSLQKGHSRGVKEYVSRLQAQIGLSPTEGHELVQDLHLTKCRSHGRGTPQSTTGFKSHPIQISVSAPRDEDEDQQPTDVVRELGRSAIREIRANTDKR